MLTLRRRVKQLRVSGRQAGLDRVRHAQFAEREQPHHVETEQVRAVAVAADLEQPDRLRRYLIFHTKAREPARELLDAIDDYVEKLTGDRRMLHDQNHGIG